MSRKRPFSEQQNMQKNTNASDSTFQESVFSFVGKLKELGNVSVIVAGLAYGCGFLITNLHLNTYGIYDFSIINARYIYTGAMFLMLCFMAYISASRTMNRMEKSSTIPKKISTAVFSWLVESSLLSLSLKTLLLSVDGFGAFTRFPITYWFYIAIPTFGLQIRYMNRNNTGENSSIYPTTSLVTVLIVAAVYALSYYPLLPTSLGGGRPTPIQLIINDKSISLVNQFLPMTQGSKTEIVYMLEQSADAYYILSQNTSSNEFNPIQVNKSLVAGIFHPVAVKSPPYLIIPTPNPTATTTPIATLTP